MIQRRNDGSVFITNEKLLSDVKAFGVPKLHNPKEIYTIALKKMMQYRYTAGTYEWWRAVYRIAFNQLKCA